MLMKIVGNIVSVYSLPRSLNCKQPSQFTIGFINNKYPQNRIVDITELVINASWSDIC